jgi:hypothetical protein
MVLLMVGLVVAGVFIYGTIASLVGHFVWNKTQGSAHLDVCPNHASWCNTLNYGENRVHCVKDCSDYVCRGTYSSSKHRSHFNDYSNPKSYGISVGVCWPLALVGVAVFLLGKALWAFGGVPFQLGRRAARPIPVSTTPVDQHRIAELEKEVFGDG